MNSIHATQTIYATCRSVKIIHSSRNPNHITKPRFSIRGHVRFSASSKSSDFQDFGSYATALRLLPATEVKGCTEFPPEKTVTSFKVENDRCLYKVKLRTSNMYGSGLSDMNAGIVICVIDENGDSILQRVPAVSVKYQLTELEDTILSDEFHFQRGSVDEFTFEGSKLGKIKALWVGVESGQWRLGGASLTTIYPLQPQHKQTEDYKPTYDALRYDFEVEDISLGEGSYISMTELRPYSITELSEIDPLAILSKTFSQETSLPSYMISNEETMSEYKDLKFSLLFYDTILVFIGASIANISGGDDAAFAFLGGGVIGFLYLFLLQRSVDGLPTPASTSMNDGEVFGEMFEGFKSPVAGLALAIGLVIVGLKYGSGEVHLNLTPKDLLVGMLGFLACKVAVVLAAFKPIPVGLKVNK